MFLLLTRILVWLLIGVIIYYLLLKLIPKAYFTIVSRALLIFFLVAAFISPNTRIVSSVWSILSFPLKPLGLAILLLLSALGGISKNSIKTYALNSIRAAILILLVFSVPAVSYFLAQQSEVAIIQAEQLRSEICRGVCPADVTPAAEQTAGAIVVLGQGSTQPNLPYRTQIQLTDSGDRILYAARLYQQQRSLGNDPVVIVSAGPRQELQGDRNRIVEATDIVTLLENLGIPRDKIIAEPNGIDVRSSAEAVTQVVRQRNLGDRIILVSSALDIRRAALTFNQLGLRVIPRPTDFYTFQEGATPSRRLRVEQFIPSVDSLLLSTRIVEEYLSSLYYFLRGWLSPLGL